MRWRIFSNELTGEELARFPVNELSDPGAIEEKCAELAQVVGNIGPESVTINYVNDEMEQPAQVSNPFPDLNPFSFLDKKEPAQQAGRTIEEITDDYNNGLIADTPEARETLRLSLELPPVQETPTTTVAGYKMEIVELGRSSQVYAYTWEDGFLVIQFTDRKQEDNRPVGEENVYRYVDVPEWTADEFAEAESLGSYLNQKVKPHYHCEKYDPVSAQWYAVQQRKGGKT